MKRLKNVNNMKNHTTTVVFDGDNYYIRYVSIITANKYDSTPNKVKTKFGIFDGTFIDKY